MVKSQQTSQKGIIFLSLFWLNVERTNKELRYPKHISKLTTTHIFSFTEQWENESNPQQQQNSHKKNSFLFSSYRTMRTKHWTTNELQANPTTHITKISDIIDFNTHLLFWNQTLICLGSMLDRIGHSRMSCWRRRELGFGHSW